MLPACARTRGRSRQAAARALLPPAARHGAAIVGASGARVSSRLRRVVRPMRSRTAGLRCPGGEGSCIAVEPRGRPAGSGAQQVAWPAGCRTMISNGQGSRGREAPLCPMGVIAESNRAARPPALKERGCISAHHREHHYRNTYHPGGS
jgi:hypothetical protein